MNKIPSNIRSGYAAILGLPNAGKSTLLNALLGQKISIATAKPQTTRKRILGILSDPEYQIIFLDTPGILEPVYLLQERMMDDVGRSIGDADVLLFLVDLKTDPMGEKLMSQPAIAEALKRDIPGILVLNKLDLAGEEALAPIVSHWLEKKVFRSIVAVSAIVPFNVNTLLDAVLEHIPVHPKYYPDDIVADANERFFVSEIIRENIFKLYREEVPYSSEVVIAEFKERERGKDYISAVIYVEKDSQKKIIVGKSGAQIKMLGERVRQDVEEFLQRPVFLELHVQVKEKWRSDGTALRSFGYEQPEEE